MPFSAPRPPRRPLEPATSGGSYGGIDHCRPVYAPEDGDVDVRVVPGARLDCVLEAEDGDIEVGLAAGVGAEAAVATLR